MVMQLCSVPLHYMYSDAVRWLKCVQHQKNAIFPPNFAISMTPDSLDFTAHIPLLLTKQL